MQKNKCLRNPVLYTGAERNQKKAKIFYEIESYLTFLTVYQLERQGANIQTKVEGLEELN
jgi:hypothetical protein